MKREGGREEGVVVWWGGGGGGGGGPATPGNARHEETFSTLYHEAKEDL